MVVKAHKEIFPVFDRIQSRKAKEVYLKQNAKVIWFTGLSGAGKTTLACLLEEKLFELNFFCQVLDGDNIRSGINKNLGFTEEDRYENIRRVAEVAKLFLDGGVICICAFISPTREMRQLARNIIGPEDFLEIYVNTPLETCELRDPKGLYKRARSGELKNFTGVSAPYEAPEDPFLTVNNSKSDIETAVNHILKKIVPKITSVDAQFQGQ